MRLRTLLTVVIVCLLVGFGLLNWPALRAPATVNLLYTTAEIRLGVTLLWTALGLVLLYWLLLGWSEARRRRERELQAAEAIQLRRLVEDSETSRLTELRSFLNAEVALLHGKLDRVIELERERLDPGRRGLNAVLEEPTPEGGLPLAASQAAPETRPAEGRWSMRRILGGG